MVVFGQEWKIGDSTERALTQLTKRQKKCGQGLLEVTHARVKTESTEVESRVSAVRKKKCRARDLRGARKVNVLPTRARGVVLADGRTQATWLDG